MTDPTQTPVARIPDSEPSPEQIRAALDAALAERYADAPKGLEYATSALNMAQALASDGHDMSATIPECMQVLAELHFQLGAYDRSMELASQAHTCALETNDAYGQARALLTLAGTWRQLGDYPTGLDVSLQALKLTETIAHHGLRGRALNTVGTFYNLLGEYARELDIYERAFVEYERDGRIQGATAVLNNIAMANYALKNGRGALAAATIALERADLSDAHMLKANVLCTIGDVYVLLEDYANALDFFRRGIEHSHACGHKFMEAYARRGAGHVLTLQQQGAQAIPLLEQALVLASEMQSRTEMFECHRTLSNAFEQMGEFQAALRHHQKFHALKESVFNDETDTRLRNLQILHRTANAQQERELYYLKNVELERENTARRNAEQAMRQYATELESQNAELDAFASTVAHDLKTPLAATLAYAVLLQEGAATLTPQVRQEFLQQIEWGAHKMSDIIHDLLVLARVRRIESFELAPLNTTRLVQEAWRRLELTAQEHHATLVLPQEFHPTLGSAVWLEEVWTNLLSNAIKYGGALPRIEVGSERDDRGMVRFWVRDFGAGIAPEQQARLFEPFERLHKHATQEGHGLGLAIVRRIVEKLGGQVGVFSKVGQGSTFYFCLPSA